MKINIIVVCTFVWLMLSACGGAATTPPTASNAEATKPAAPAPIKLKVAVLPTISFAPFYIAQGEGFFAAEGLEVEFVRMEKGNQGLPALVQGELDVLAGNINLSYFNAMAQENIKFVAEKGFFDTKGCSYSAIVTRKELNLTNVADLKGKTASLNKQNIEGYYLDVLLKRSSLTLEDINIKADIPRPAEIDALKRGSVDFIAAVDPWVTQLQTLAGGTLWKSAQEIIPDAQFAIVLYGSNLLIKDPNTGKNFMVAYLKGVQQYNQGKTARNLEILTQALSMDEALLKQSCWPSLRANGQLDIPSTLEFQAWGVAQGIIKQVAPPEKFWEPKFVNQASQELGLK